MNMVGCSHNKLIGWMWLDVAAGACWRPCRSCRIDWKGTRCMDFEVWRGLIRSNRVLLLIRIDWMWFRGYIMMIVEPSALCIFFELMQWKGRADGKTEMGSGKNLRWRWRQTLQNLCKHSREPPRANQWILTRLL